MVKVHTPAVTHGKLPIQARSPNTLFSHSFVPLENEIHD